MSFDVCKRHCLYSSNDVNTKISQIPEHCSDLYHTATENIRGGGNFFTCRFELSTQLRNILNSLISINDKKLLIERGIELYTNKKIKLFYFDAINLYGFSLSQHLPINNYSQIDSKIIQ